MINKKSVLEAFRYIIANKPTLGFVGVCWMDKVNKKVNKLSTPIWLPLNNWLKPWTFWEYLGLLSSSCPCGNSCLTRVLVELESPFLSTFLQGHCLLVWVIQCDEAELPSHCAWWMMQPCSNHLWAISIQCAGSYNTCTGMRPKHIMFMAVFQSGSSPKYLDLGKMVKYYTSQWLSSLVFVHCLSNKALECIFEGWGKHWQ